MSEQGAGAGWYADPSNDPRVQRYWDGSAWTVQRVWDGARWAEPAQVAPAVAPPAVPPNQGQRRLWIGAALGVTVVGVVVAVIASSGGSDKSPASVGAHTFSPVTGASGAAPPAGSANAIRAWENEVFSGAAGQTNAQAINGLEKDIATIGHDYSSQADDTTLRVDCERLAQDVIPTDSPDATVNANLKKASDYIVSASVDCDVDDPAAATELNKAVDYLNTATSHIKSLGG
jgi:Protein of unknown function (DUF2510)